MAGYMFPPMCYIPKSKEAHSVREKVTYYQISSNSLWAATSKQFTRKDDNYGDISGDGLWLE